MRLANILRRLGRGGRPAQGSDAEQTRGPKAQQDRWLIRLTGYCWRYRRSFIFALTGAVLATAFTAIIPLLQRSIIDNVIVTHKYSIWPLAIALLVVAVATFGATFLRRYFGGRLSLDVQHDLRTEMLGALSRLDGARQDEIQTGQLISRSISDINMIQSLLSLLPIALGSVLLFVVSIVIMLFLSPLLTVVALAVAPALWFIALRSRGKLFPASWTAQQQAGEVAAIVDETVGGVRVVKGFGQEEQEVERMEGASTALYAARVRLARLMARFNPALEAVPTLGQVGVLALGGWLAIEGNITLGTFLAFSSYLAQMTGPVRLLTALVTIGQESRAGVIRVLEVIDSRPVISDKPGAEPLPGDVAGIEFDDVRFGYVPSEPVLRGPVAPGRTGRDDGRGRRLGLGQVDAVAAAAAVLRRQRGRGPGRRVRRPRRDRDLAAGRDRAGPGGQLPVLRHRAVQHRLRAPGRHRRAGPRGRRARPRPTSSSASCRTATTP